MNSITAMCVQSCFARVQRNEVEGKLEGSIKLTKLLFKTAESEYYNPLAGRWKTEISWGQLTKMLQKPLIHGSLENLGIDLTDAQGICKLMAPVDHTSAANMPDFARAC